MSGVATFVGLVGGAILAAIVLGGLSAWCWHLWSERDDPNTSWKAGLTLLIILAILKGVMKH